MAMTNMKTDGNNCEPYSPNQYGYGLSISLTEAQVDALGLRANPPAAGAKVMLHAQAVVTRVAQEAEVEGKGGVDVCLSFQITDLEVASADDGPSAATLLYGG
ncbi:MULTISPECIES: capsid staple protein [unclassified Janthinobacterium]|uniref:capsid staple protein n=1 Tax=unclassified Janthinobacterium TaxID=2610881 RepID=UPI0003473F10|nr:MULTISPECIES: hypothetical protein [unclassified Janthinobacterium]MEC5161714.1 hypothetical protein [Janthinobacterium sp. CG_S6]